MKMPAAPADGNESSPLPAEANWEARYSVQRASERKKCPARGILSPVRRIGASAHRRSARPALASREAARDDGAARLGFGSFEFGRQRKFRFRLVGNFGPGKALERADPAWTPELGGPRAKVGPS